jgi:hypothetical protein
MTSIKGEIMNSCKYIIFFAVILISGCATVMKVSDGGFQATKKPIGVYVCSSSQLIEDNDYRHRNFVINLSSQTISDVLIKQGYSPVILNTYMPHDQVFKKYLGAFNIDEKIVAKIAKEKNCDYFLILYYANANVNLIPDTQDIIMSGLFGASYAVFKLLNSSEIATTEDNLKVHSSVSLYGWLFRTEDISKISASHSPLISFRDFITKNNVVSEPIDKNYYNFYQKVTVDMFGKL